MPCAITTIDQTLKDCLDAIGGLKSLAMIERSNVTGGTVAGGVISALTITGSWVPFKFDRDKTSFLTAVTERPSQFLSYKVIDGLIKFADPEEAEVVAANAIDCCTVVVVVFGNNGLNLVLGLQHNEAGDDIEDALVSLRVNADIHLPPGDEESRIEYKFVGQQKNVAPYSGDEASVGIT